MQHVQAARTGSMDKQRGLQAWTSTWTWTCSLGMDMQHGKYGQNHAAWTLKCSMNMAHAAWTWVCSMDMDMQDGHGACSTDMDMQQGHGHAVCPYPYCMHHVHVHDACSCWISISILQIHVQNVHSACPCPLAANPSPYCMDMTMLHVYLYAAFQGILCPCCMSTHIIHVHVHVPWTRTCSRDVGIVIGKAIVRDFDMDMGMDLTITGPTNAAVIRVITCTTTSYFFRAFANYENPQLREITRNLQKQFWDVA